MSLNNRVSNSLNLVYLLSLILNKALAHPPHNYVRVVVCTTGEILIVRTPSNIFNFHLVTFLGKQHFWRSIFIIVSCLLFSYFGMIPNENFSIQRTWHEYMLMERRPLDRVYLVWMVVQIIQECSIISKVPSVNDSFLLSPCCKEMRVKVIKADA